MNEFEVSLQSHTNEAKNSVEKVCTQFYVDYLPSEYQNENTFEADNYLLPGVRKNIYAPDSRESFLLQQESIRKSDLLKEGIRDILKEYIGVFRVNDSFFPNRTRDEYKSALDKIQTKMIDGITFSMDRNLIAGVSASEMAQRVNEVFGVYPSKLSELVQFYYKKFSLYAFTKVLEEVNGDDFTFVASWSQHICERCDAFNNQTFTCDELAESNAIPPLHPHCRCVLKTRNGTVVGMDDAQENIPSIHDFGQQTFDDIWNRQSKQNKLPFNLKMLLSPDLLNVVNASNNHGDPLSLYSWLQSVNFCGFISQTVNPIKDSPNALPTNDIDHINEIMRNSYGFEVGQTTLLIEAYIKVKEKYGENPSAIFLTNKFYGLLASLCFNYDAKRWHTIANTKSTNDAMRELVELGLTQQQVDDLVIVINRQHGNVSDDTFAEYGIDISQSAYNEIRYKDYKKTSIEHHKDFAHEAIQLAIFSNSPDKVRLVDGLYAVFSFIGSFGAAKGPFGRALVDWYNMSDEGRGYSNYEGSFKGDIDSGRYDAGDFASDLDAINIYYRITHENTDVFNALTDYNYDVNQGTINRAEELLQVLGNGSEGVGWNVLFDILSAETPASSYILGGETEEETKQKRNDRTSDFLDFFMNEYKKGTIAVP